MTPRIRRMWTIGLLVAGMALATGLILQAFEQNLMYFYSPSDVHAGKAPAGREFRIGGMVVNGSVKRDPASLAVTFTLTDYAHETMVTYRGILPDLFREGQGIVANGSLGDDGRFVAREVLAKHDENYMPPEVADSLKQPTARAP
ncbi:MAG: cytochrome c maturation protein CcmE [Gammaproteobacteria bacterium]